MLPIAHIEANSIAASWGVQAGDQLLRINQQPIYDSIDYIFFCSEENVTVDVKKSTGEVCSYSIEKEPYEELGFQFPHDGLGKCRSCVNHCRFCFVDQLPPGMRKSLYVKDDDWRLSFIMGNYVTLTNVGEKGFQRILDRQISPLYISVHATDDDTRAFLLGQERARGIMDRLRRLKEAGLTFQCQAVIAPGINDGEILEKTISDLASLYPACETLALVPVGLTEHREGLAEVHPVGEKEAKDILAICDKWQQYCLGKFDTRFVFPADELYIKAGLPFPPVSDYETLEQIEDGVGLVPAFLDDARYELERSKGKKCRFKEISIATGVDMKKFLQELADECKNILDVTIHVYPVENHCFGKSVTVSGLLTGKDIASALAGRNLGEAVLFTQSALRASTDLFLDDMSLSELCDILKVPCIPVAPDGMEFIQFLLQDK